ncbi:UDP-glucose:glycoprotein glucosyltransferase [Bactrocera neohumeralis]|uniref:UDP-glucose:glycoprotein glucosyltransferase n=1 Tax=Bactrocera tryoni TaxID=59916 RepID=UPI001A988F70|nr:UDP-glucose:glycoprotein glucosyltransferase [Bactrocera tryoni]XP_050336330.1 UDP-glucose:glycoprotein glucosyltransferase [Bactrocera neohumeralis]
MLKEVVYRTLIFVYIIFTTVTGNIASDLPSSPSQSYSVTTLINAKWQQTPLYLEIAEYLADENPALFWDYVNEIVTQQKPIKEYASESNQYLAAINIARNRLNVLQLPLLKLVVSLHSLTPRIQTHLQISNDIYSKSKCNQDTFVQIDTEVICNIDELREKLNSQKEDLEELVSYSFDHVYPGSENNSRTVILHGDFASNSFSAYHKILSKEARSGNIRYIVRHYLVNNTNNNPVRLSGYGVELHLKSTEYKSQDDAPKTHDDTFKNGTDDETEIKGFDFKVLKNRFPTLSASLDQFRYNLLKGNEEITQLKAWEFQDLGLQATRAITEVQGDESLQVLQFIAHNFPMQAHTLLHHKISDALRTEIKHNIEVFGRSLNIIPPDGALFINGLFFDADTMDLGAIVETVRAEVHVLESLHKNNIRGPLAAALLALDLSGASSKEFAIDIRDTAVMWINDIETDAQYRRWPSSVMDLLRPAFPGMLRNIRKNIFNLVLVVDPLNPASRNLIKLAESFVIHQAPVRLGLVFDIRSAEKNTAKDYNSIICAYNYVTQNKDGRAALSFLTDVFAAADATEKVRHTHIRSQFKKTFSSLSGGKIDDILGEDSDYDYGKQLSQEFIERLGFANSPQALLNGVPMQQNLLTSDSEFEEAIFSEIIQQTSTFQKAVYKGDLTDTDSVIDYLMNQDHVMPRLNQRILNTDTSKFLDFSGIEYKDLTNIQDLAQLSNRDMTATLLSNIKYFGAKHATERIGNYELNFLTIWIIADIEQPEGRELLANALNYLKSGSSVRIGFLPNVEGSSISNKNNLNRLAWAATQTLPPVEATDLVLKWLNNPNSISEIPNAVNEILSSTELHMKMLRVYVQRIFGLPKSLRLVVGNGKIFGPLSKGEKFNVEDFGLIDRFNAFQYADKIRKILKQSVENEADTTDDTVINSDTVLKLYASLVPRQSKTRFKIPDDIKKLNSVVSLAPKQPLMPHFDISAVVDPASRSAQKLAPILILLRNILNCEMNIYLTPVGQHSDMPVKNFYRYVVEPEVQFQTNGKLAEGPISKFTGLPVNSLLTQNLQVPENWLVEAVHSVYDLDNIKLSEIGGPVHSEYELEYLLLEGHCFDSNSGAPPRGLQVTLGTHKSPAIVDTIVMANLGYFQLKANPGVWELRLREGKSADIYDIGHAEGPNTIHQNQLTKVVINSLRSHVIKLRVAKKPGKQNADLLGDDEDDSKSGIWNSIASSFGGGSSPTASGKHGAEDSETINIFSVASGHLYERLLRIMMLSVLKHTKSPVKFWFLKNYLSPQFTDFLPHMAREYGFQYELVQYKWPRWLHQQTEKQRTIWGYKILFLDVLFPLNVRKIIFVDADAIVRTDIKELYDMDLGGAPYAYTPFCDSRKEMEGFRFWKQGYWRSHLMGRRYHISALYVVDLKRFRKIAAGDRLRGQYQALSQDPNSLANLDQDLPNNMIHQVAIKSLPDEWLWCQTWCSDSSFKKAKVIDLCNNPMTKEAKLTAAQRIVPEWKDYDVEIKNLMMKIEDHENNDHYAQASATNGSPQSSNENNDDKNLKHEEL